MTERFSDDDPYDGRYDGFLGEIRLLGRGIAAEVIEPRGHGLVNFTLPGLRDYLREHAASSHWGPDVEMPPVTGPTLSVSEQESRHLPGPPDTDTPGLSR